MSSSRDIAIVNARLLTMDPSRPEAGALAARDGVVHAVGTDDEIRALIDDGTQVIDAGGRFAMPGFYDSHNHLLLTGLGMLMPSLAAACSVADVQEVVREAASELPPGTWVQTSPGWHERRLTEQRFPTRAELDAAAPDHPVFVRRGGHNAILNSAALAAAGIDATTPNPPGATYVKDATGDLTGHVVGLVEVHRLSQIPPQPTPEHCRQAVETAGAAYAAQGVTSLIEPGLSAPQMAFYRGLAAEGALRQRVSLMWMAPPLAAFGGDPAAALDSGGFEPRLDDPWCRAIGVKLLADGGVETGFYREPYVEQDDPDFPCGKPLIAPADFAALAREIGRRRWHLGVHTMGDAAIDFVLDAFEDAHAEASIAELRWTLIHLMNPRADHWPRIERMRPAVAMQPSLLWQLAGGLHAYIGPQRTARVAPLREVLDRSATPVGGGSDSPIAPFPPLLGIASAVTRDTRDEGVVGPEWAITVDEALAMYTTGSAWCGFEEDTKGCLAPGRYADVVVLSDDPRRVPADEIAGIEVLLTLAGDRVTHDALR